MNDTVESKISTVISAEAADISETVNGETERSQSLADAHRLATLAALRVATSAAARARHASKRTWGRR